MIKFLTIFVIIFAICGCQNGNKERTLDEILSSDSYIIVDVRTEEEYNNSHVVGSINIPYDEIDNTLLDKNKTIIVYCQSGNRSKIAYDNLISLGYDVYDLGAFSSITLEKE